MTATPGGTQSRVVGIAVKAAQAAEAPFGVGRQHLAKGRSRHAMRSTRQAM
jgi:hypothetical protein